jgi:EmrB/QacA subfamily drug resistance transporter
MSNTLSLNCGMFLTALDFNIVSPAVNVISSQFGAYDRSAWLGTGYLISFALVMPFYGKLGEVFSRRSLFIFGTLLFILGSGLCGGSNSMNMLIASRVVQGLGGGGVYSLVNVIVTDLVPLKDVGKYLSFTGLVWAIADVAGPLVGGAFAEYASWRWCFYINLCISPISLIITLLVLKVPAPTVTLGHAVRNFDYIGALAMTGGTTMVLLGISWGGVTFPWNSGNVIGTIVGGAVLVIIFAVYEHFVKEPLIPPVFLRNRAVMSILIAEFFYGAVLLAMMYYVPQFFQLVFGDTATLSGVSLLPLMLGLAIGNPVAGWITSKWGISLANAWVGAALEVLVTGLMTRWNAHTSRAEAVVELVICGIGQGAAMEGLLVSVQASVLPQLIGVVTALAIFTQTVGDIFGIAFFATVYQNELRSRLVNLGLSSSQIASITSNAESIRSSFSGSQLEDVISVYADSMQNGWWLTFACAVVLLISSAFSKQHSFKQ